MRVVLSDRRHVDFARPRAALVARAFVVVPGRARPVVGRDADPQRTVQCRDRGLPGCRRAPHWAWPSWSRPSTRLPTTHRRPQPRTGTPSRSSVLRRWPLSRATRLPSIRSSPRRRRGSGSGSRRRAEGPESFGPAIRAMGRPRHQTRCQSIRLRRVAAQLRCPGPRHRRGRMLGLGGGPFRRGRGAGEARARRW